MANIFDTIGNPGAQFVGNTLLGLIQAGRAGGRRPAPPTPSTRNTELETTRPRTGLNLSPSQQAILGDSSSFGSQLPRQAEISIQDIMESFLGDEFRNAEAINELNERLRSNVAGAQSEFGEALGNIRSTRGDLDRAVAEGQANFDAGREALNAGVQAVVNQVKTFRSDFREIYTNITSMRGDVLAEARDNTAALMVNASNGITLQVGQALEDQRAAIQAQGIPQAQIDNQLAQVAANGIRMNGDLLTQVGAEENARISDLSVRTGQWVADISNAFTQASGSVIASAASSFTTLATARANLETGAADWRSRMTAMRADLDSMFAQTAMAGRVDLHNMQSAIMDPVIRLGPIMEGVWSLRIGLEDLEHQYQLENFNIENSIDGIFFESTRSAFNRLGSINEARHQEGVARNIASQNRTAAVGTSVLGAFTSKPGTSDPGSSATFQSGVPFNSGQGPIVSNFTPQVGPPPA